MALEKGFRIGTREVLPLEGRILGPAGAQHVEPKAMQVLLELARHGGEPRSRRQIEEVVWPRGFVSEDALTRCIRQLLAPTHRPSQLRLAWALALDEQARAAREALDACGPQGEADVAWLEHAALVEAACGRADAAAAHHAVLVRIAAERRVSAWSLARAAAAAGRRAEALAALEAAAKERSTSLPFLRATPAFEALHGDPRFEAMAAPLPRRLNVPSARVGRSRRGGRRADDDAPVGLKSAPLPGDQCNAVHAPTHQRGVARDG